VTVVYQRILVPLDGSALAEQVLPYVQTLAERFDSTLLLLRATLSPASVIASTAVATEPMAAAAIDPTPIVEAAEGVAVDYLFALGDRLKASGLRIELLTAEGPAGDVIVEQARTQRVDLVAMATHGRAGLDRVLFGSIADDVLHHAGCPVLLVRVDESERSESERSESERSDLERADGEPTAD
jgi:nucleotide-binding universal stress UspA family protein